MRASIVVDEAWTSEILVKKNAWLWDPIMHFDAMTSHHVYKLYVALPLLKVCISYQHLSFESKFEKI